MKLLTLIFLFLTTVCIKANERFILNSCPQLTPSPFLNVHLTSEDNNKATCATAKKFADVLSRVHLFIKGHEKLFLTIFYRYTTANYEDGGLIRIPERMIKRDIETGKEFEKNFKSTLITFAHEYGHSILASRLKQDLKEYNMFKIEAEKIFSLDKKMSMLMENVGILTIELSQAKVSGDIVKEKEIFKMMSLLGVEFKDLKKKKDKYKVEFENSENTKTIISITTPYHELFGDIIAALYSNDPRAMYKAQFFAGMSEKEEKRALMRDFTEKHEVDKWAVEEPHGLFAPTRYYLWKNYWPLDLTNEQKRNFVEKLYESIQKELISRFKNLKKRDPREINLSLMKSLSESFGK